MLGHGVGYLYSHNAPDGWVDQDYLGVDREYYQPVDRGKEAEFLKRLTDLRSRRTRKRCQEPFRESLAEPG